MKKKLPTAWLIFFGPLPWIADEIVQPKVASIAPRIPLVRIPLLIPPVRAAKKPAVPQINDEIGYKAQMGK